MTFRDEDQSLHRQYYEELALMTVGPTMRAAYVNRDCSISMVITETPSGPLWNRRSTANHDESRDDTILKTRVSTICGSDFHQIHRVAESEDDSERFAVGHETVGEIVFTDSSQFRIGQRVLHVPPADLGRAFGDFQAAGSQFLIPLPDALSDDAALLAQQLGTVVWALRQFLRDGPLPSTVCVLGAGPAGLLFVKYLKHLGVPEIIVSEPVQCRRQFAAGLGAVVTTPEDLLSAIDKSTGGEGVPLIVEASGSRGARAQAMRSVSNLGTVGLFGIPRWDESVLDVDLELAFERSLHIVAAAKAQSEPGLQSFRRALDLIESGSVIVTDLISHRFSVTDLDAAFGKAASYEGGVTKVAVDF